MQRANRKQKNNLKCSKRPLQTGKAVSRPTVDSPAGQIEFVRSAIGNHAMQRVFNSGVIQAKLKIGEPNDSYEQEADRMAEQVMRMPENSAIGGQRSAFSRESESIQMKPG